MVPVWLWELFQEIYGRDDLYLMVGDRVVRRLRAVKYAGSYRMICKVCNNGWMSTLEAGFGAIAIPAIRGEALLPGNELLIDRPAQQVVATWCAKFWLLLNLTERHHMAGVVLSPDSLHYIYEHGAPPPGMSVYLATANRKHSEFMGYWPTHIIDEVTGLSGMMCLVNIRPFAFCIMVPETDAGTKETGVIAGIGPDLEATLVQIWPNEHPVVRWPTAGVLDERLIAHLFPPEIGIGTHDAHATNTSPL